MVDTAEGRLHDIFFMFYVSCLVIFKFSNFKFQSRFDNMMMMSVVVFYAV